jgi:hypothetical protein
VRLEYIIYYIAHDILPLPSMPFAEYIILYPILARPALGCPSQPFGPEVGVVVDLE